MISAREATIILKAKDAGVSGKIKKITQCGRRLEVQFESLRRRGERLHKTMHTLSGVTNKAGTALAKGEKVTHKVTKSFKKLDDVSRKNIRTFRRLRGSLLGVGFAMLFGGMALKRFFTRILKSGVSAFTRIIETTNNTSTATQVLSAHWEYLKFTIGSTINRALEPLMPWLIRLISWASEWVQKHPETVFKTIVTAIAVSGIISVLGQVGLAAWSLIGVFKELKSAGLGLAALKGISKVLTVSLGAVLIWKGISDFKKDLETKFDLWEAIKTAIELGSGVALLSWAVGAGLATGTIAVSLVAIAAVSTEFVVSKIKKKKFDEVLKRSFHGNEEELLKLIVQLEQDVETANTFEKLGEASHQLKTTMDFAAFGIENFQQKLEFMRKQMSEGAEEDFDPIISQVSNLSMAFGERGKGLNDSIKHAVSELLPGLKKEMTDLTEVLKNQRDMFNNTAAAIERYNRALEGEVGATTA